MPREVDLLIPLPEQLSITVDQLALVGRHIKSMPGLLLAILRPDLSVTLTESVGKKAKVLQSMVKQLKVKVCVEPVRAEKVLRTADRGAIPHL